MSNPSQQSQEAFRLRLYEPDVEVSSCPSKLSANCKPDELPWRWTETRWFLGRRPRAIKDTWAARALGTHRHCHAASAGLARLRRLATESEVGKGEAESGSARTRFPAKDVLTKTAHSRSGTYLTFSFRRKHVGLAEDHSCDSCTRPPPVMLATYHRIMRRRLSHRPLFPDASMKAANDLRSRAGAADQVEAVDDDEIDRALPRHGNSLCRATTSRCRVEDPDKYSLDMRGAWRLPMLRTA